MTEERKRVLFVCTHNSARSQMAEGLLRGLGGDLFEAASAGTLATSVRPEAVTVMAEIGLDLDGQESKTLDRYVHQPIDTVITVCDAAKESCPTFFGADEQRHWSIEDPAAVGGEEPERLAAFRAARDELRRRIEHELLGASNDEHHRKLEKLYLDAPTNRYYSPSIRVTPGRAEIAIDVRPDFFHAAGAAHGTLYFKLLDDACFFAVASEVEDVFVLTSSFHLDLLRPVSSGTVRSVGRVVHRARKSFLAEATAIDDDGRPIARGGGTFVRSRIALSPEVGYR